MIEPKIVFEDKKFVVRVDVTPKGELKVYAHRKDKDGKELQPRGYWLGSSSLIMEESK